jgi:hypothetical protein
MDMKFPQDCPASLNWRSQMAAFFNDAARFPANSGRFEGMGQSLHAPIPSPSTSQQAGNYYAEVPNKAETTEA